MQGKYGIKDVDPLKMAEGVWSEFKSYFTTNDGSLPEFCVNQPPNDFLENDEFTSNIMFKHKSYMNKQAPAGPDGLPGYF
jgi:hypothetical protein